MDPKKMFSGAATCEDIMQCFFNLNEFEMRVYDILVKSGPIRSRDLAEKLKKDPTTLYRALQKLVACGICYRETKTIKRGGYYHMYAPISPDLLREKVEDCIDKWNINMKKALSEFDDKFLK